MLAVSTDGNRTDGTEGVTQHAILQLGASQIDVLGLRLL
jgi:hypothetical protein